MAFPPVDPDAVGTLIIHANFSNLADGAAIHNTPPNVVNINGVNWQDSNGGWQGTAAGGQVNANTDNRVLHIDTQTDYWYARITVDGLSAITGKPTRLFNGSDGENSFFSVEGYAFNAPSVTTTGQKQLRLTRVNSGVDNTIQTNTNANAIWPDPTVHLQWDDRGADPIISCRVVRSSDIETIEYTDSDASKHSGVTHQYLGIMTGLISEVKVWDLNQPPSSSFAPWRMLMS